MSEHRFAYDTVLKRPGCALLQAAMGCDASKLYDFFLPEDWLLAPTPDLKVYGGDKALWTKVGEMTVANRKNPKESPKKA